jgi:integrase
MAAHLKLIAPSTVKRTVERKPNAELRTREHLTQSEVDKLIGAAKQNRQSHRDATKILLAMGQGLRTSEVCDLRWDQVDFDQAVLHVRRVKAGTPSTHPLAGSELRALREQVRSVRLREWFTSHRHSLPSYD